MEYQKKNDLLDLMEARIEALKKLLITPNGVNNENFSESLLSANTVISSIMKGHQNTSNAANRNKEIETYLETNCLEKPQDISAKQMYVKSIAPTMAITFEMLKKVKELEPTVGADYFKELPDKQDFVEKSNWDLNEAKQKNYLLEESLILAMKNYSTIQKTTTNLLKNLDEKLTEIEDAQSKPKYEE